MNYQEPKLVGYTALEPSGYGGPIWVSVVVAVVIALVAVLFEVVAISIHGDSPCG